MVVEISGGGEIFASDMLMDMRLSPNDIANKKFYRGRGCDTCNNSGFKGRAGLFELMVMNDELRDMISWVDVVVRVNPEHLHWTSHGDARLLFEFPDEAAFHEWYDSPDYQELVKQRQASSEGVV